MNLIFLLLYPQGVLREASRGVKGPKGPSRTIGAPFLGETAVLFYILTNGAPFLGGAAGPLYILLTVTL